MTVATSPEDLMTTFLSTAASAAQQAPPRQASPLPPPPRLPVKLPVELALAADRHAGLLTEQIAAQLRDVLTGGRRRSGEEQLPSSRALAAALGVSRTVVTAAYTQLFAEGWLEGRHGSGTYVAPGAVAPLGAGAAPAHVAAPVPAAPATLAARPRAAWPQPDPVPPVNLRPGIPWRAGIDRRPGAGPGSTRAPSGLLGPIRAARPALREALTGYLRRRPGGVRYRPDQILAPAAVGGLGPGHRRPAPGRETGSASSWLPGGPRGLRFPRCAAGARCTGWTETAWWWTSSRVICGSSTPRAPVHRWAPPAGAAAPGRWPPGRGPPKALIVEDDCDGEFRYDVAPLPTLFGLDPEVVIYLGTTSKTRPLPSAPGAGWSPGRTWSPRSAAAVDLASGCRAGPTP